MGITGFRLREKPQTLYAGDDSHQRMAYSGDWGATAGKERLLMRGVNRIGGRLSEEENVRMSRLQGCRDSALSSSYSLFQAYCMALSSWLCLLCSLLLVTTVIFAATAQPLVPAVFIFGDSVVDAGNNNRLYTVVKANFPPYGRDFASHRATGRFCNGKLASDFTVENIGFTSYPPAYLSDEAAAGRSLLTGANFASGGSGYCDYTAKLYNAVSLSQQLEFFKQYQTRLSQVAGNANATSTISGAICLLSAGSSDFVQNYYVNPLLYRAYTPDQFSDILLQSYSVFIQVVPLGARRIGVTTLPPIGCLPASITVFGSGVDGCVQKLNRDAISFNHKLNVTSQGLRRRLSGLNLVVLDIYQPLYGLVANPSENGFAEARRACCGSGLIETSVLCNAKSVGTCANASQYVFWDGFHPTEAANRVLADSLLLAGISLIS
uniref:GDSL esterase/lipase n=1 Tax=Kalanchoe fedtschenkoi TaxID=63787 RepID=A0A7N0U6S3_KALFE